MGALYGPLAGALQPRIYRNSSRPKQRILGVSPRKPGRDRCSRGTVCSILDFFCDGRPPLLRFWWAAPYLWVRGHGKTCQSRCPGTQVWRNEERKGTGMAAAVQSGTNLGLNFTPLVGSQFSEKVRYEGILRIPSFSPD